jgi:cob(I)alamin adenosyltransferase
MARISTGTGDDGTTGLVGGARVPKTSLRVAAYGAVDELNDVLGLAAALATRPELRDEIRALQRDLFTLGADLSALEGASTLRVDRAMVERLVAREDALEASLPPLRHFILPGGTPCAAALQMARSAARRAEREAWRLQEEEGIANREALVYLNRLSDLLFLLAREENQKAGVEDAQWLGRSGR